MHKTILIIFYFFTYQIFLYKFSLSNLKYVVHDTVMPLDLVNRSNKCVI